MVGRMALDVGDDFVGGGEVGDEGGNYDGGCDMVSRVIFRTVIRLSC